MYITEIAQSRTWGIFIWDTAYIPLWFNKVWPSTVTHWSIRSYFIKSQWICVPLYKNASHTGLRNLCIMQDKGLSQVCRLDRNSNERWVDCQGLIMIHRWTVRSVVEVYMGFGIITKLQMLPKVSDFLCFLYCWMCSLYSSRKYVYFCLALSLNLILWLFHTRTRSVWVSRRYRSHAACELHTLPISRRWGKRLGFCTFCWSRQQLWLK